MRLKHGFLYLGSYPESWRIRLQFVPQDCWVGVFWRKEPYGPWDELTVWICLLPMLPLRISRLAHPRMIR